MDSLSQNLLFFLCRKPIDKLLAAKHGQSVVSFFESSWGIVTLIWERCHITSITLLWKRTCKKNPLNCWVFFQTSFFIVVCRDFVEIHFHWALSGINFVTTHIAVAEFNFRTWSKKDKVDHYPVSLLSEVCLCLVKSCSNLYLGSFWVRNHFHVNFKQKLDFTKDEWHLFLPMVFHVINHQTLKETFKVQSQAWAPKY